jgi:very-short-patch-repair endonuclease/DNA polymerase III delta prime subunit
VSAAVSDPGLGRLKAVLDGWRNSLLDMGGRNRLLHFRHTRSATLEITSPGAGALLADLAKGWEFAAVLEAAGVEMAEDDGAGPADRRARPGLVTQKTTQASLDSSLYQLRQKAGQMYNDYGLWVLWLGVGMLDWREADAHESSAAPLILVPVELRRDSHRRYRLHLADDQDRIHNPALAVKLERLGVDWSPVTGTDVTDLPAVMSAARSVAAGLQDWSVDERVVLGLFASHREAMYQDLQQNEDQILGHPLVRAVALGPDAGLPDDLIAFDPPDLDRIDDVQLPERTPLVLDADASQRQCIAAALDNRSFVMSGPPGTGKSQTITNMIAALMHAGRSVLFVSEKAAALDVVRNRLRGVGLGDFVMALHSGDTSKKAVAAELARVLTTEARVTGAAEHELERARKLREELSAYAAAMNETREPLQRTLHDVLGRLVLLEQSGTPNLPLTAENAKVVRTLTAGALQELATASQAVSRAWRPAAEGDSFPWRGLVGTAAHQVASEASDALDALLTATGRRPFAVTQDEPRTVREVQQLVRSLRAGIPDEAASADRPLPEDVSAPAAQLADLFGLPKADRVDATFALCELADLTTADHRPPRGWFDPDVLRRAHAAAEELRRALDTETAARDAAADVFGEQVLTTVELPELVRRFADQHRGLKARFSAQYKADRAAVAALTHRGAWDKSLVSRLEQALAWHTAAAEAARSADHHTALLGRYTPRGREALADLDRALATADRIAALSIAVERRDLLADRLADDADTDRLPALLAANVRTSLGTWCAIVSGRAERWTRSVTALLDLFDTARRTQLSPSLLGSFDQAEQVIQTLLTDLQGPDVWHAYLDGLAVLARHGADGLVANAAERGIDPHLLPDVVEQALLRAWADGILTTDKRLRSTRSDDLDARVADFKEADRRLIAAAGGAVIEACNKRRPRRFGGGGGAVIIREAEKKTRHMPVRELLGRTREVVQSVKPCFMMSPLTVSQFLPADFHFDVVVFDEASQVRPSDAVNCIYRGRTLVVAGDDKQLPPTSFFDSSVDDDSDEFAEDVPDSFESLLHACKAGAMRELPLRWHYRSRHEDLITFSNREFYANSMVTFPGALDEGNDVGVAFLKADGVYDRGGRRDNRAEADFVAGRVIHHFDTRPDKTLGVVALSQAQASAIDEAVQQARLARPDLDHCFTEDRLDGFFVKNLESVQGDERDVMIMSVGYGPDEHGKLGLNFGPINKGGGWRRLNVAVTRARHRMEVVASFRGTSLPDSPNESVQYLKRYLEYAESGPSVLARDVVQSDAEPDSPFEESVLAVLRGWGYRVQPQVGVAGYRIDLGVRHPELPGAYALGIECDGAMYHSSKAARDRDRLREQVLNGLGWRLHRIWGTDWYRGRGAAELRLREAVEQAVAQGPLAASVTAPQPTVTVQAPRVSKEAEVEYERVPVDTGTEREWSAPYRAGVVVVSPRHELHTPEARPALRKVLAQIIEAEGPVHEDLLVQRAREAWGVGRAGNRIRDNVREVARTLVRSGLVSSDGAFFDLERGGGVKARHPQDGETPRKIVHIAPAERHLALRELAAECPGMSEDELIKQVCEFFGWRRTGKDIRECLAGDIADLYEQRRLEGGPERVSAAR